jgi:trehalose 2-sulfotransferase
MSIGKLEKRMAATAEPRLPKELEALRPRRAYIVCATPRSGSTLLCQLLEDTGVAGRPAEHVEAVRAPGRPLEPREYFSGLRDRSVLDLLAPSAPARHDRATPAERLARMLRAGTGPNGVFGTKLMWGYMDDLQEQLAALPPLAALDGRQRLSALLGDVRYLRVRREDLVAQAVSMWRAVQTRAWRAEHATSREPVYSFAGIDHLRRQIAADDRAWTAWFRRHDVSVLEMSYSQLAAGPGAALRSALEFIGAAKELAGEPPAPTMRRQADAQSRAWAERYRREQPDHR